LKCQHHHPVADIGQKSDSNAICKPSLSASSRSPLRLYESTESMPHKKKSLPTDTCRVYTVSSGPDITVWRPCLMLSSPLPLGESNPSSCLGQAGCLRLRAVVALPLGPRSECYEVVSFCASRTVISFYAAPAPWRLPPSLTHHPALFLSSVLSFPETISYHAPRSLSLVSRT
jgi:hypothetical protein